MVVDLDQGGRLPQDVRTYLGPTKGWVMTDAPTDIEYIIGQDFDTPPTGRKGCLIIPQWVTINNWCLLANAVGSAVVDIWKISLATYLAGTVPTAANSITGSVKPTLSNQAAAQGFTLTGWTTDIEQNDVLCWNLDSISGITQLSVILQCIRQKGQS